MQTLLSALAGAPEATLDRAALDLASIEFPSLVAGPYLERLDAIALELGDETNGLGGAEFIAAANTLLFDDIGFRGNEADYYDPRNSCLNWVMDQRTGIPITLSLLYMEVARRLGRQVYGIGLPGHFIVRYDDGNFATYLDPFNGGKLMSEADCRELVTGIAGAEALSDPNLLRPVDSRHVLVRMLNNLRGAYLRREDFTRVIAVLDVMIEASPQVPDYYRDRGVANVQRRKFRIARADFERYLELNPQAADRREIVAQLEAIHRWLGSLN